MPGLFHRGYRAPRDYAGSPRTASLRVVGYWHPAVHLCRSENLVGFPSNTRSQASSASRLPATELADSYGSGVKDAAASKLLGHLPEIAAPLPSVPATARRSLTEPCDALRSME